MKETKGREASRPKGYEDLPSARVFDDFSSPKIDQTDRRILSSVEDCSMTALHIAKKLDMSFLDCLRRTRKLWKLRLLVRVEARPEEIGLYRYSAKGQR